MNALEFLKTPPAKVENSPIVALVGDDAYLVRQCVASIGRTVLGDDPEMGVRRFQGPQAKLAEVLDELRTLPFFAKRRMVVVEDADPFVTDNRKELETYAEAPSSSGVLVLQVKTWPSTTKLAKAVEKVGFSVECKTPKEKELPGWLTQLARTAYSLKLDAEASNLLVELVGPEPGLLAMEVEKLAVAVSPAKSISREAVAKWVGAGRVESIWEMLDLATTGKGGPALAILDKLLASGEPPVRLIAALTTSLLKLYHAGTLRASRRDLRDACQVAGIPPFAVEKTGAQHAHLGPSRVNLLPSLLLSADLDLKGSSTLDPRTLLERLLLTLSSPRKD